MMKFQDILLAKSQGKYLVSDSRESAKEMDIEAFDTEAEAIAWAKQHYEGSGFQFVKLEQTDIEVPDAEGYYSGSHGRYSLVEVNVAVAN